ncbi:MAG: 5'-nucleotidase C-terminal domain-containing protein, partial [Pseudoflavonifractor sp.]
EFNFEFDVLKKSISEFKGATLAGNVYKKDGTRFQPAYKIFDVNGVKVAIFGVDAPHVPQWEASGPERFDNMTFTTPMEETGKILKELEGKADVVIASIHYGLEGEYGVEGMREVVTKYASQLDGVFIGHAHAQVDEDIAGVPVLEPSNNGKSVGKLTVNLTQKDGKWAVSAKNGELLDCSKVKPDEAFLAKYKGLHDKCLALAAAPVGEVGATFMTPVFQFPGIPTALIQDNPITDLVNLVQTQVSGADVSLAALFTADANLEKGPFLNRDSVKIYKYDNTLFAVKVTGKQLKAIMEKQAGNFFNTYKPGDVTISFDPNMRMYNYDMFSGVTYDINISKAPGDRIENLSYKGAPMKEDQVVKLALNNYRYGGLVKAGMINAADVTYEGGAVRDMITDYVAKLHKEGKALQPVCDNNWKITGAPLDDPQKEAIYAKLASGEIKVPTSEDGRTPNVAAVNGPALRAAGTMPALPGEKPAEKP